jgi:hypothetical protein
MGETVRPVAGGDDFYIGYRHRAPSGLARFLRRTVVALGLSAAVVAAALAGLQGAFDPGVFEFGVLRDFEGVIDERPHPLLLVDRPGRAGGEPSRFLLVAAGKHGAGEEVDGLDGRRVRLHGTLIHRQGQTMVELVGGSVEAIDGGAAPPPGGAVDLGIQTLRGEIVDSKCFLGVMKPGRGNSHRACATLCIRGGIPPVMRVETAGGEHRHFLLTDEAGGAVNDRVLDLIAVPVEITGRVLRAGDLLVLETDPRTIRRLGAAAESS